MRNVFILLIVLLGIPSFAAADTLGCVGGAATGIGIGSLLGGGNGRIIIQAILGLSGCGAGSRMEDGTYGQNSNVETVYVNPYGGGGYYGGGYSQSQGMYLQPGMCDDPNSGGQANCAEIARRYQPRSTGYVSQYQQPATYTASPSTTPYPRNMWEVPGQVAQKASEKTAAVGGPTTSNYIDDPMIHPSCKKGNPGADGKCLLRFVDELALEQKACEGETTRAVCPTKYNPGKWAAIYSRLGRELVATQVAEQGGVLTSDLK